MEYCRSTMYTPRCAVLLQEQVDPAHYTAITNRRNRFTTYTLGRRHCVDGEPSYVYLNGARAWFMYDRPHRDGDKPAHVDLTASKWFWRGVEHRDHNKPSSMRIEKGEMGWCRYGRHVRDDGKPTMLLVWSRNGVFRTCFVLGAGRW